MTTLESLTKHRDSTCDELVAAVEPLAGKWIEANPKEWTWLAKNADFNQLAGTMLARLGKYGKLTYRQLAAVRLEAGLPYR